MNIGKIGIIISLLKSFRKLTTPNKSTFALIPFRYLFLFIVYYTKILSFYNALYTVIRARATTNIPRPISNQTDFVFNDTALPSLAPTIEPMSAKIAGNQIISPRDQNIVAAPIHVKIVTHKEVAIALWISHPVAFKKAGNREPALPPRMAAIKLSGKAQCIVYPKRLSA